MTMFQSRVARDAEEFAVRSNGGNWLTAWHTAIAVPAGTPHGANDFCVRAGANVWSALDSPDTNKLETLVHQIALVIVARADRGERLARRKSLLCAGAHEEDCL